MSSILDRFVDFATGNVTADVDNNLLTTDELSINGELHVVTTDSSWSGANGGEMIQSAVDAADATDEVWVVGDGPDNPATASESDVWKVSSHLLHAPPDNLTLRGVGGPLLYLSDNADDDIIRTADGESDPLTDGLTIRGFRLDANRTNQDSTQHPITAELYYTACIRIVYAENVLVENVVCERPTGYGVEYKLTQDSAADAVTVRDTGQDDAVSITDDLKQAGSHRTERITVRNVRAENLGQNGSAGNAVEVESITGCVNLSDIKHIGGHGTPVRIENCADVTANGLVGKGCTKGIIVDAAENVSISDVVLTNVGGMGVTLSSSVTDLSLTNFVIEASDSGTPWAGIHTRQGGTKSNISISNGTIRTVQADARGIELDENTGENINISNVTIDCNGVADYGVVVESSNGSWSNLTFDSVTVHNALHAGVNLVTAGSPITDVSLDVTAYNNGQDTGATDDERAGVRLDASNGALTDVTAKVRAYDDQGTKTQQYGIYHSGADYCIYDACNLRGNATGPFGGIAGTNSINGDNIT